MYTMLDLQTQKNEFEGEVSERVRLAIAVASSHPVSKFLLAKSEGYITPFCIIISTTSPKQIDAITIEINKKLKEANLFNSAIKIDGNGERGWCIIDVGDCFINIITEEKLSFYKLEDIITGKALKEDL